MRRRSLVSLLILAYAVDSAAASDKIDITETDDAIHIDTPDLEATISKKGYVTGVKAQSFRDKRTGFRDAGFGLDIVDWIMEPGSDEAYRDRLDPELIYRFGNEYHGDTPKRSIEGPQICTQAKELHPDVIRGEDFVAVKQQFRYPDSGSRQEDRLDLDAVARIPRGKAVFPLDGPYRRGEQH